MGSSSASQRAYLDVQMTLVRTRPLVRRRFLVRVGASLAELCRACQDSVQMIGSHDWLASPDAPSPRENGSPARLRDYFVADANAIPTVRLHDFTEGWDFIAILKGTVRESASFRRRLISGQGAAPLDDCGGPNGHAACVDLVRGRACLEDRSSDDFVAWVGDWDPDAFDLERAREDFDR